MICYSTRLFEDWVALNPDFVRKCTKIGSTPRWQLLLGVGDSWWCLTRWAAATNTYEPLEIDRVLSLLAATDRQPFTVLVQDFWKSRRGDYNWTFFGTSDADELSAWFGAWLKILYALVMIKRSGHVAGRELVRVASEAGIDACNFVSGFVDPSSWLAVVDLVLNRKPLDAVVLGKFFDDYRSSVSGALQKSPMLARFKDQRDAVRCVVSFLRNDGDESKAAYNTLVKLAPLTGLPYIYASFVTRESIPDHTNLVREFVAFIRAHEQSPKFPALGWETIERLRKEKASGGDPPPGGWPIENYQRLNREITRLVRLHIMWFVRQSGRELVPIEEVYAYFKSIKLTAIMPIRFVGSIDVNGNYFSPPGKTTPGRKLFGCAPGIYKPYPSYNPDTDNSQVASYTTPSARGVSKVYSWDYKSRAAWHKFAIVDDFVVDFDRLAARWRSDLTNTHSPNYMLALMVEALYVTTARIGSRVGTVTKEGTSTFGLTSLLVKHMVSRVGSSRCVLRYRGKKGMEQCHTIDRSTVWTGHVCDYLNARKAVCGPKDFLWVGDHSSVNNPKADRVDPTAINNYLRHIGVPAGFSAHKIRSVLGTQVFDENVARSKIFKQSRQQLFEANGNNSTKVASVVNREVVEISKTVGARLGHFNTSKQEDGKQEVTGGTALTYYINPSSPKRIYDKYGVTPSETIRKIIDKFVSGSDE